MFTAILPQKRDLLVGQQIVFFAINKTGSTSIWNWMDQHRVRYLMNRYQEDEARKQRVIFEVKRSKTPAFAVVRNPWERAVSSWKWCMLKKGLSPCSFEEFLRIPFAEMTPQQRYHTSPQWQHIADENGNLAYLDHIGRMDRIEDTRQWVAQTLNLADACTLPHLKKTEHERYTQYYTSETKELVADIFHKDIETFGYEFDDG